MAERLLMALLLGLVAALWVWGIVSAWRHQWEEEMKKNKVQLQGILLDEISYPDRVDIYVVETGEVIAHGRAGARRWAARHDVLIAFASIEATKYTEWE